MTPRVRTRSTTDDTEIFEAITADLVDDRPLCSAAHPSVPVGRPDRVHRARTTRPVDLGTRLVRTFWAWWPAASPSSLVTAHLRPIDRLGERI